jgi:tetratricopeptide (TPR) repeat protein
MVEVDEALDLEQYVRAIALLTRAMMLEPQNAALVQSRGAVHAMNEDLRAAIRDYAKAIALHPGYAEAHLNRGLAEHELGDHQAAVKDFTAALDGGLASDELKVQAHYFRGLARHVVGDRRGAVDDHNAVVVLAAGTPVAERSAMRAIEILQELESS